MARIAYVNGRYLPCHAASVHIEDRGYQFADGVYEYIAFYNRRLLDGELHLLRLERSLNELQIPLPVSLPSMLLIIRELIRRNNRSDGGLYIQVSRGVARRDHPFPKNPTQPSLVMTVSPSKQPSDALVRKGVKVITQPDIRWGRCDIKSISLLANILAKQEAAVQQARESWLIKEDGTITEGAASNAYIVTQKGELITHPLGTRILGGITRHVILNLAQEADILSAERPFTKQDMAQAAEAFMTSTSANILPVVTIDNTPVGDGAPGPITRQLHALYLQHIHKQTGRAL